MHHFVAPCVVAYQFSLCLADVGAVFLIYLNMGLFVYESGYREKALHRPLVDTEQNCRNLVFGFFRVDLGIRQFPKYDVHLIFF